MTNIKEIYYTDSGPDCGGSGFPVIVLIPDLLMTAGMFRKQKVFFRRKYRVITIDYHDRLLLSAESAEAFLKNITEEIIHLMDVLKVSRFILCGVRMGGFIALNAAAEYGDRVCGMIVSGMWCEQSSRGCNQRYLALSNIHLTHRKRNKIISSILRDISGDDEDEFRYCKDIWTSYSPTSLNRVLSRMTSSVSVLSSTERVYQPVLVMHGGEDNEVPVQMAADLAAGFRYSRLTVIPGGGHIFTHTHGRTTNNVIQFWLNDYFC